MSKPARKPGTTRPTTFRLTDADLAQIDALGRLLLPSNPPSRAAVIRQAVQIARQALAARAGK